MNLETLLERIKEIETAIVNTTNQLNILFGHKNETQHWVNQIQNQDKEIETPVEPKVDSCEEVPVE